MAVKKRYYSLRTGTNPNLAEMDFEATKAMFNSLVSQWEEAGYF